MSKYIDADALKDIIGRMIPTNYNGEIGLAEMAASEMAADIVREIDEMPAAYDVDAVIEKVRKIQFASGSQHARVISAIRRGGKNE